MTSVGEKRKRPRAARACELCRSKKYRCDEDNPCSRCRKLGVQCVYVGADAFRLRSSAEAHTGLQSLETQDSVEGYESGLYLRNGTSRINGDTIHTMDIADGKMDAQAGEIIEVNPHTQNREFHGLTSPLVIIAELQRRIVGEGDENAQEPQGLQSSLSYLHNEHFSPRPESGPQSDTHTSSRFYFRQSRYFLDGYFQNLHFIHPFIDQSHFMSQCERLWFEEPTNQPQTFISLYFAVMSLGALIREWPEETLDGKGRLEWSRELYRQAALTCSTFTNRTDVYSVQASIIMAKVAQNELSPHLAYMHLGSAVRTSLSAGYNRAQAASPNSTALDDTISKTWWALYSLEIEMSFALGRPDSLGPDIYHNRSVPRGDHTEIGIVSHMVEFARIIRTVSTCVYAPELSISKRAQISHSVETRMRNWIDTVPKVIRPNLDKPTEDLGVVKDPTWAKKQRHTLRFRYYNVKMILYMPFLLHAAHEHSTNAETDRSYLDRAAKKCLDAAECTIQLMYHLFSTASYFRTWWYNTTYVLYATSIIFHQAIRFTASPEKSRLLRLVERSIEMLGVMDEMVVAKKAATLLQQTVDRVQRRDAGLAIRRETDAQDWFDQAVHEGNQGENTTMHPLLDWLWDDGLALPSQPFGLNL